MLVNATKTANTCTSIGTLPPGPNAKPSKPYPGTDVRDGSFLGASVRRGAIVRHGDGRVGAKSRRSNKRDCEHLACSADESREAERVGGAVISRGPCRSQRAAATRPRSR